MKLIGYVAHNLTLKTSASKTVRLRNATNEVLRKLTADNLDSLTRILKWNIRHGILFYRISSNLIPFASHPVNTTDWPNEFGEEFAKIGKLLSDNKIVVSMHPGQYTVLSSPSDAIVKRAVAEIEHHNTVLELLDTSSDAKIIIHLGGGYGSKDQAIKRFIKNYKNLSPPSIKRLVIENDDVVYNVGDCLKVSQQTGLPIVFDTLHYQINPDNYPPVKALEKCLLTWDSPPEVHYSDQAVNKPRGAHAEEINVEKFLDFYNDTKQLNFRIMLETKDKEQSVLKIIKELNRLSSRTM